MTVNDGGGLYDKYGLIQSVIDDIAKTPVAGYEHWERLLDCGRRLTVLKEQMKAEDERAKEEI